MLLTVATSYAQIFASQAGIAVQGIARDANNTAITNGEAITLQFTIYYDDAGTEKSAHYEKVSLTPDSFGVFSHVINVLPEKNIFFSNYIMNLRIETQAGAEISDEPLRHVPYAISANNGVPTGSIMPFVGASNQVPKGWVLCDGKPLPASAVILKAMIGDDAPNLGGMFLRGAGTNTNVAKDGKNFDGNNGPTLNETQDDKYLNHAHSASSGDAGKHKHKYDKASLTNVEPNGEADIDDEIGISSTSTDTSEEPAHSHAITVNTSTTGGTETRPVNYGVNYIIKL